MSFRNYPALLASGNLPRHLSRRNAVRRGRAYPLYRRPVPGRDNHSARRINAIASQLPQFDTYLEVGLSKGTTFEQVRLSTRVGVDPQLQFEIDSLPTGTSVYAMTSDEFFATLPTEVERFHIVFLDGLHEFRQTYQDLLNAYSLGKAVLVVIDDVVPTDEISAVPDQTLSYQMREEQGLKGRGMPWHGDVYKVMCAIERLHPEIEVRTIIDGGNPQALTWLRTPDVRLEPANDEALVRLTDVSYEDVFSNGVPDSFRPCTEEAAVEQAVRGIVGAGLEGRRR
jgi:hypothetical protein